MPGPQHQQRANSSPCDECAHAHICASDGHQCKAYANWQQLRPWRAEHRTRPPSLPNGHEQQSQRAAEEKHHSRVCLLATTKSTLARQEAAPAEIAADDQHENEQPAEARCVVSTIDVSQERTSRSESIAPPVALYETLSLRADEHAANVSYGTIVAERDEEELPTFEQSRRAHAVAYLTSVLIAAGGERAAAARIAGVGRTHMQALIRKYAIDMPPNLKARANHRFRR